MDSKNEGTNLPFLKGGISVEYFFEYCVPLLAVWGGWTWTPNFLCLKARHLLWAGLPGSLFIKRKMKATPEGTPSALGVESGRNAKGKTGWMFKNSAISWSLCWVNYNSVLTLTKLILKLICLKTYQPWYSMSDFLFFPWSSAFISVKSMYYSTVAVLHCYFK